MREITDEKGLQESNLTAGEERGLKSLKKRVASGEIVICQTDKSGKFALMTMADYIYAGSKHVKGDQEVDIEYVNQNQRILNAHCSMWLRIFLVGKNWGHQDRHREAKIHHSLSVCPLYLMFKDHKGWAPDKGPMPTRGICAANTGMNCHLSHPGAPSINNTWIMGSNL